MRPLDSVAIGNRAEIIVSQMLKEWNVRHIPVYGVKWWLSKEPFASLDAEERRSLCVGNEQRV